MIVVDSSAVLSVLLGEREGDAAMGAITAEDALCAPALLPYEVLNVAGMAIGRRPDGGALVAEALAEFLSWPWAFESHCSSDALGAIARIASRHGLTAYDASYVELAVRRSCPLVTFDAAMRDAARKESVEVLPRLPRRGPRSS